MTANTKFKTRRDERGSVMIMTAILMFGIILAVGLCIDVSRVYMVRTELQNAADAAALCAARELNSGSSGIQDGVARATSIVNNQGFSRAAVTIANVEFAVNLDGTYVNSATAQANPANIRFVRVSTQTTDTTMLFSARVLGASHTESRSAVAGMSVGLNTICDFFPAAVALTNPNPAPGTPMTLKFAQGTGNSVTLVDQDYVVLEVPDFNGNGTGETAALSAGITSICKSLGDSINMTPSSNPGNGPRNSGDGLNTRFNVYANGYSNALTPGTFPPDSNIREGITATEYKNRTAVTAPNPNGPGKDDRRLLVVPIVAPGVYPAATTNILKWGVFFIKSKVPTPNGNCSSIPNCGSLPVEYVGDSLVIGRGGYTPGGGSSNLTIPVLYR
jgi:Flp pilus assembly protein TadG